LGLVEIDGSYMEGGGQIVRTAVGLAAATGRACRVVNVRKARPKAGLAAQHLSAVRAVGRLCDARIEGDEIGSTELTFRPLRLMPPARLRVDVGTAGAVTLVLQALLIPLAAAGARVELEVRGGTHVKWAPTTDYFERVFARFMEKVGFALRVLEARPGFYPRGGGLVRVEVRGGPLRPLELVERGELLDTSVLSLASETLRRARVAERQIEGARRAARFDEAEARYAHSPSPGTAVLALARYSNAVLGASALGERGRPAEQVGGEAARLLAGQVETGACLDEHMTDQILPYLALAGGESRVSVAAITDHCRTNMAVIGEFLPVRFEVDEGRRTIACRS